MEKLIIFIFVLFIVRGFSARTIDNPESNDALAELREIFSDLEKVKVSISHSSSSASHNRSVNIFICNNCNYTKNNKVFILPNTASAPEMTEEDMKDLSSFTSLLSKLNTSGLDNPCEYHEDCRNVPYSECSAERCSCKPNYFARNGKCFGLIKEACKVDSDCGVVGSSCQSKFCECKNGYYGSNNTECLRFARGPGDFCGTSRGCLQVKHSSCVENVCECETTYRRQGNSCLGLVNATCLSDDDCAVKNSSCHLNTCQCPNGFYSDDTCYKYAESLTEVCQSDEVCKHLPYSSCLNGHCRCLPNYVGSSGTCLGMINAPWNNSTECVANNAVCNVTCQCPDNHYFENNQCFKYAEKLFVPVDSAQACQSLANSFFTNKRCECSIGFYYEDHQCHKIPLEYESPVSTARGCEYLEDAYFLEGKCYSSARNVYDPCHYDHQCKVSFSSCSNGTCQCKQGYVGHENVCYGLQSARCNVSTDCALVQYSCQSGNCTFISYIGRDAPDYRYYTPKPGASVIYADYSRHRPSGVDHLIGTRQSNKKWATGNLAWKSNNYTLDKVYFHQSASSTAMILDCRVEAEDGKFMFGSLVMPGNGTCTGQHNSQSFSSKNYSLLIDLGK